MRSRPRSPAPGAGVLGRRPLLLLVAIVAASLSAPAALAALPTDWAGSRPIVPASEAPADLGPVAPGRVATSASQ
jgi:hypothetical protein